MTGELAVRNGTRTVALNDWDDQFRTLVKSTVLKPKGRQATDAELALFAEQAQRTGLDPMTRQIYGVYRKSQGVEQMTIQVGIDGLRAIAERTGHYLGQTGPYWCGQDGQWRETWLSKELPRAAKVIVRKVLAGQIAETPAVAHYDEYVPTYQGKPMGLWGDKPALMLAKCAEALALRKAFPNDMSGLYTDDEMQRADAATVALPTEAEAVDAEPVDPLASDDDLAKVVTAAKGLKWAQIKLALSAAGMPIPGEAGDAFTAVPADKVSALVDCLVEAGS